ncbi:MAG: tRNA uridine-5-carboxymethylaminomethyl(34) synthesis enzyme MnmG [Oscillospiraceae bacterium]|jgi:tRNA uridine 5-carboxymethylaminomethyl modification enzyme|nr:tRNA uridine-5-carboxymethylaminomethyl(34) synthesis enzyme MnmG [Oscillospiraceae bacterium]
MLDIIVIGAGHAGIEAGLAAARLGARVAVYTIQLDWVGNMPCNPSVGGSAKGHLVREIDALGGEMGRAADAVTLQSRLLNLGKGPAVHSPRAQVDRRAYSDRMKCRLEMQEKLELRQAEIVSLEKLADKDGWAVLTRTGAREEARCVVLATGTFLAGQIHLGELHYASGPDGMPPAAALADSLRALGLPLRRFKTGTPARVHRRSLDLSKTTPQSGDAAAVAFSFSASAPPKQRSDCYLTYTNAETRRVILENLHRSPLFGGQIEGVGPRYCPSIEDKMVRFPDRERHPVFIEPCGADTQEMYLQGLSSSLPEDVQLAFLRTIPGLEHCQVMRLAYAIEYDCVDPLALRPTLEFADHPGLFGAGQFNGSSGYEEAAAQGLVAGINAARKALGLPSVILPRTGSYIGTLIDDLVTKGCAEPYRMMTSRSEVRLLLRQDTADRRLTPLGQEIGLVSAEHSSRFEAKLAAIAAERQRVQALVLPPTEALQAVLRAAGTAELPSGARLADLLCRPQLDYALLAPFDPSRPELDPAVMETVAIDLKYEGYLRRQEAQVRDAARLEECPLPEDLDYAVIPSLRTEAREKLAKVRPLSVGQASRISGVNPADVSALLIWMEKVRREGRAHRGQTEEAAQP